MKKLGELLPTCRPDELAVYMGICFRLSRPDLTWAAYRRMEKVDPKHPVLALMPAQYGALWFTFRKVQLGIPTADDQATVDVRDSSESRAAILEAIAPLARELDDEPRAALAADLKTHGIRSPKLLLDMGIDTNQGFPAVADALEEDPDNEVLLALAVFSGISRGQTVDAAPLGRAFKKFRHKRPELAVMAAVQAAMADQQYAPLLDEALKVAATIEQPNPLVMMSLARSLWVHL